MFAFTTGRRATLTREVVRGCRSYVKRVAEEERAAAAAEKARRVAALAEVKRVQIENDRQLEVRPELSVTIMCP